MGDTQALTVAQTLLMATDWCRMQNCERRHVFKCEYTELCVCMTTGWLKIHGAAGAALVVCVVGSAASAETFSELCLSDAARESDIVYAACKV